jgi:hypothetical protein
MTTPWKGIGAGGPVLGGVLAGIAIYQEEMGRWNTSDSLTLFFWALVILLPVSCAMWPLMHLKTKREAA